VVSRSSVAGRDNPLAVFYLPQTVVKTVLSDCTVRSTSPVVKPLSFLPSVLHVAASNLAVGSNVVSVIPFYLPFLPEHSEHCVNTYTVACRGVLASEVYRLSDHHLSTKFSVNFCG
jgi:hypothetical protein